jgi:predicted permease
VTILSEIRERVRALFRRGRDEHELDEELRFHLEMQAEEYVRGGMRPDEARRRAAIEFGGVERVKEEVRHARGLGALESVARDVGYAWKSFRSGRSGLLLAAAVLALAIGAGSTAFSVVSGVLLDSLPFADPERLVNVRVSTLDRRADPTWGATMSRQSVELATSAGVFESAAHLYGGDLPVLTGRGDPLRVNAWFVGPEFFEVLGARPLLGRTLTRADAMDKEGGSPVVLSHRFWTERFGRSPDAVGQTLRLDGRVHTVAGVMPPGFEFPERAQLWQPAALPAASPGDERSQGRYWLVARLAPGVTPAQARARIDARFAAHGVENPEYLKRGPNLAPLRELITGPVRRPLLLVMGAVALVILVACANVAAVLLARGITRRRELAIRISLGATRARVAGQLVTEAVLLALVSGACGTLLALAGVPLLVSLAGDQIPATARIGVDGRVLAYTLAASTLTGLAAGLFPALVAAREDLSGAMRDGSAGSGTGAWLTRMGEGLVVLQVGLGTILVSAAALLALSFANLMNVEYGFDPGQVAVAKVQVSSARYATAEQQRSFVEQVSERARAHPGVQSAAASSGIPFDGGALGSVEVPGKQPVEATSPVWFTGVTPDYFRTLGIALLRGRALTPADDSSVVVVNESLVRTYFPGENPIGRTLVYYGSRRSAIVGVVADARQQSLAEPAPPQLYGPLEPSRYLHLTIRTAGDAGGAAAAMRQAIRSVDPALPVDRLGVMDELVSESAARPRFHAVTASTFALIALLITALGIYGLTAYSVSRRSREIGIRLALGASGRHIYIGTVGRAALLAGGGVALGLMGAWAGARLLDAFVFGLSTTDPRVLAGVALLLTLAAVAAAMAPARRAGRIDPVVVLRTD